MTDIQRLLFCSEKHRNLPSPPLLESRNLSGDQGLRPPPPLPPPPPLGAENKSSAWKPGAVQSLANWEFSKVEARTVGASLRLKNWHELHNLWRGTCLFKAASCYCKAIWNWIFRSVMWKQENLRSYYIFSEKVNRTKPWSNVKWNLQSNKRKVENSWIYNFT
jgi:hypothetical protein